MANPNDTTNPSVCVIEVQASVENENLTYVVGPVTPVLPLASSTGDPI
jgi:hypothetical protein